ncbi:MAG: hypothetical protein FWD69_12500 [Polyangiaceae bacterium]|nr:hypothetical protein [Polyangiaceae bacterium]
MRAAATELLAKSPMLALPLFALFLFLAMFAVILVVTMRKRATAYDSLSRMPLDDECRAEGEVP